MNRSIYPLFLAVSLWACGGPDSTSLVGSNDVEAGDDLATTGDALLSNAASVWFPMQEGNTWTLATSSGAKKVVSYSDFSDGIAWLDGLTASGEWAGTSSDAPNTLYKWDDAASAWSPYFRFGYSTTAWKVGSGACNTFTARRTATGLTVVTPAGTFTDARTITFTQVTQPNVRCAMPAFSEITFAPNVGPVVMKTAAGDRFTLKTALVGGTVYPKPTTGNAKGTLKADHASYVNQQNTIRCITTPCPSNEVTAIAKLTFTVTNTSGASVTWQFNSGKQFDVDVVSSSGKVVARWGDGRMFITAMTNFTLSPGQSKTFTAELPLKDRDGLQLDGSYTLKAYLVPRNGAPTANAQASISVSVQ